MSVRTGTDPGTFTRFGDLLKHLRQRARLTQRELGVAVGYSDAHITRLEAGQRQPDPSVVRARFIEALDLRDETALAQRLLDLATNTIQDEVPGGMHMPARPTNLPTQLTPRIGRQGEIAEVLTLVQAHRLVTLTGSGGVGKTRLALEIAASLLADSPLTVDGVWLIELGPLTDPVMAPRAVAAALGVHEERDRPLIDTLSSYLREKRLLLILDNCEHLIDTCAHLAEALLRQCREARILATSREALGVAGELAWRVPSLQTADAVQLFAQRATLALPSFALTAANAPAVQGICARLDGIPLAIELAAARVRALPVERIAERLSDRFRLLTGGSRTALPRQQTLRATIDWSYNLLAAADRALLARLSVFAGGWTLEAAEAVCGGETVAETAPLDVLDSLTRLVDKSLVVVDDVGRYHLLETIRQYAREKLIDTADGMTIERLHDRHLDYYVRMLDEVRLHVDTATAGALRRMTPEIDNVRAALGWSVEAGRVEDGLHLMLASHHLMAFRGSRQESLEWAQTLLALPVADPGTMTRVLALSQVAQILLYRGKVAEPEAIAQTMLTLGTGPVSRVSQALAYGALSFAATVRGDYARAHAYIDRLREMLGDVDGQDALQGVEVFTGMNLTLNIIQLEAETWFREGEYARAEQAFAQVLARVRGNTNLTSLVSRLRGYALLYLGERDEAVSLFRESLLLNTDAEDRQAVAACLAAFGAVALADEDLGRAARLYCASDAISQAMRAPLLFHDDEQYQHGVATLRTQLDGQSLFAAEASGRAMNYDQMIAYALEEDGAHASSVR